MLGFETYQDYLGARGGRPYRSGRQRIDIDRYTIETNWGSHSALHSMGWNRKVKEFIDLERTRARPYTRRRVFGFINELRRDFNLRGHRIALYEDEGQRKGSRLGMETGRNGYTRGSRNLVIGTTCGPEQGVLTETWQRNCPRMKMSLL